MEIFQDVHVPPAEPGESSEAEHGMGKPGLRAGHGVVAETCQARNRHAEDGVGEDGGIQAGMGKQKVPMSVEESKAFPVCGGENFPNDGGFLVCETRAAQVAILGKGVGEVVISPKMDAVWAAQRGMEPFCGGSCHGDIIAEGIEVIPEKDNLICGELADPLVGCLGVVVDIWDDESAHGWQPTPGYGGLRVLLI